MKAKWGMIVVDGSGKIGGHVASKNRSGSYFRTKVTPVNPQTIAQSTVRARLTGLSQAWRGLTEAMRTAWNNAVQDFARTNVFGDLKNPSGFNLYQRLNNNLETIGEAAIDFPPLVGEVENDVSLSLTIGVSAADFFVDFGGALSADTTRKIFATSPQSPGKSFVKSEYRLIKIVPGTAADDDVWDQYVAKFGAPVAGQKIFVKSVPVNNVTGQEGQGLTAVEIAAV